MTMAMTKLRTVSFFFFFPFPYEAPSAVGLSLWDPHLPSFSS
jgi:hypothetical protein